MQRKKIFFCCLLRHVFTFNLIRKKNNEACCKYKKEKCFCRVRTQKSHKGKRKKKGRRKTRRKGIKKKKPERRTIIRTVLLCIKLITDTTEITSLL